MKEEGPGKLKYVIERFDVWYRTRLPYLPLHYTPVDPGLSFEALVVYMYLAGPTMKTKHKSPDTHAAVSRTLDLIAGCTYGLFKAV